MLVKIFIHSAAKDQKYDLLSDGGLGMASSEDLLTREKSDSHGAALYLSDNSFPQQP